MFIVWGKRVIRKKVGYVADFCPMCREAQTFLLREVRTYSHIYYIPTSASALLGYERVCQVCELALHGAPKQYVAMSKKPGHVTEIMDRSFPGFHEVYGERLKIEESLRMSPDDLSQEMRRALIQQPFLVLSPMVEARCRATPIDWVIGASFAGAFALMLVTVQLTEWLPENYHMASFVTGGALGMGLIIWAFATALRRFVGRKIAPRAAKTLKPLRPTEAEIASTLAELKRMGHRIGGVLKPKHMIDALRAG